jgi:RND family efflux transporter MFP subunit
LTVVGGSTTLSPMNDKSALLNQLRIDRSEEPRRGGGRWWVVAALLVVVGVGIAAWVLTRPAAVAVRAVVPQTLAGGAAPAANSVLDASGYVVARRQATVSSKVTGKMIELDIEEGDHVKAGQVIAKLDDSNIRAALAEAGAQLDYAKAGLAETEVNMANAQRDYDRQSALLKDHFVSQAAVDTSHTTLDALHAQLATQKSNIEVAERALEVADRNLDDMTVRAPFSGVVTVKAAQPGEIVSPISAGGGFTRTGIGTIVDMDSLEIQVDVNENFINRVKPGQPVSAKLNAYPDWTIPAHVLAVIPTADRSKGTVTVRIALDAKDPRILPEMGVRVAFLDEVAAAAAGTAPASGTAAAGFKVPADAVQVAGATGAVFVIHGDTVERRAVRVGANGADGVTILSGITATDRLAAGDLTRLQDGTVITIQQGNP